MKATCDICQKDGDLNKNMKHYRIEGTVITAHYKCKAQFERKPKEKKPSKIGKLLRGDT